MSNTGSDMEVLMAENEEQKKLLSESAETIEKMERQLEEQKALAKTQRDIAKNQWRSQLEIFITNPSDAVIVMGLVDRFTGE